MSEVQSARPVEQLGRVIVSQSVLVSVVEMTALMVPGVVRLVSHGRFSPRAGAGVRAVTVTVEGNVVRADLGIVAAAGTDVAITGAAVRQRVAAAIERLLGMEVKVVNVVVWDIEGTPTRVPDRNAATGETKYDD